ncbi:hypothetical protein BsWGS_00319 [Bradybaena similaris]
MSVLQKLLLASDKQIRESQTEPCEEVEEGQPHNPYTEILILQHHSDIVRLLLRISDRRFVSAGDDKKAVIWEVQYGRRIATLIGHSQPITSLLLLPPVEEPEEALIVTGSSDKQIRIWNSETGECLHILTEHGASVKCLHLLSQGLFCAGGENLSLWNRKGQHLCTAQNCASEDINSMISVKNDCIVAAADIELVCYEVSRDDEKYKLLRIKQMMNHSEAIHSLVIISASAFASGSVDGMILVWATSSLQPIRRLHPVSDGESDIKRFPHSVQSLMCLQERYLFAAVGCGFYAYDISKDKDTLILQKKSAHLSKITSMGFTCEGELLATCSEDKCLRLWGHKPTVDPWKDGMAVTTMEKFSGLQSQELLQAAASSPWEPSLLGECCAHGGSVQGFLDFEYEGIVTCGSDGFVIIWKNSEMQKVRRNQAVRKLLLNCDGIV